MPRTRDQLLSEALELPLTERAHLVEALIASLDDGPGAEAGPEAAEIERAWAAEAARRAAEIDAGRVRTRPAEEVFRAAREHLRARRAQRRG
jgi:putative addiction module component (TIGR02574 family)